MSAARHSGVSILSLLVASVTALSLAPLVLADVSPSLFSERAHGNISAAPLVFVAVACVVHPVTRRAPARTVAKAGMLAAAFLFWAATQLWPSHRYAPLFNDVAIALFVVDVLLVLFASSSPRPAPAVEPGEPAEFLTDPSSRESLGPHSGIRAQSNPVGSGVKSS